MFTPFLSALDFEVDLCKARIGIGNVLNFKYGPDSQVMMCIKCIVVNTGSKIYLMMIILYSLYLHIFYKTP